MSLHWVPVDKTLRSLGLVLLALHLWALVLPANAVPLYTTGFEDPPFTLGDLAGQDGWAIFASGSSVATTRVEDAVVKSGAQAVSVSGSVTNQSGPFHSNVSTGPLIDLSADILLKGAGIQTTWQFAGVGPGLIQYLGGIDIFGFGAIDSVILLSAGGPVVGTFTRGQWHHVDLLFNLTTQTYTASLDGTVLALNVPLCGDNVDCSSGAFVSTYGLALFDTFGNRLGIGDDTGYLDNFSVEELAVVPEPTTFLLWSTTIGSLGLAGCWRRCRRK